jgi:hypothetical protein
VRDNAWWARSLPRRLNRLWLWFGFGPKCCALGIGDSVIDGAATQLPLKDFCEIMALVLESRAPFLMQRIDFCEFLALRWSILTTLT